MSFGVIKKGLGKCHGRQNNLSSKLSSVLYISYDGMTDPLGQSQVLPYLLGLSREGYRFVLLSCEKPDRYRQNRYSVEQILSGTSIHWSPVFYTKKPPILSSIFDYWKLKRKAINLHRIHDFGLVHCRSYLPAMLGLWMKSRFKVKFLFDMRGFWADERVDGGLWNLKNPIYRQIYAFFKKKEKKFLENADHVVSLTHAGKAEIEGWRHIAKHPLPVTVIPCCVDADLFDPRRVTMQQIIAARQAIGIRDDESILTYVGSTGTWYLIDEMFAFFRVYLERFPSGRFLFITQDNPEHIRKKARLASISDNRIVITAAKREEVPILALLGQFSLFFIKPSFSKKSSSPTKQGELMALGIPIICNSGVGDTDWIVHRYGSGLIVTAFDDANYREIVSQMEQVLFDADKIRGGARDYFAMELGLAHYAKIYKSLLN